LLVVGQVGGEPCSPSVSVVRQLVMLS
jgi:hypothetical protein